MWEELLEFPWNHCQDHHQVCVSRVLREVVRHIPTHPHDAEHRMHTPLWGTVTWPSSIDSQHGFQYFFEYTYADEEVDLTALY